MMRQGSDRRELFQVGGLSLAAISPLGLSLSDVLANEAAGGSGNRINVIFMFLQGGASHIDMFDPKPEVSEIKGEFDPIGTSLAGVKFSDKMPALAARVIGGLRRRAAA